MSNKLRGFDEHPLIVQYLERVCGQVKARDVHEDIRLELLAHLEDLAEERSIEGVESQDVIVSDVLKQMGDPEQVGKGFHAVHKPKPEWSVIALIAGMICIALVSIFSLHSASSGMVSIEHKLIFGFLGIVAMTVMYFVDYRKLLRFSWLLYGGTVLLIIVALLQEVQVNGSDQWIRLGPFFLNVFAASPYLFLISIAGILQIQSKKLQGSGTGKRVLTFMSNIFLFIMLPTCLYFIAPALEYFTTYCMGLAVLLFIEGKIKLLFSITGSAVSIVGFFIWNSSLTDGYLQNILWDRLTGFLQSNTNASYMTDRSLEAIQWGGLWGQGFGVINKKIPYFFGEMQFTYLVYSMGWIFGIVIVIAAIVFIARVIRMGYMLNDRYAKALVVGISTVLGTQLLWNICMCLGLLPIGGFNLPIMNWTSLTIIELAAVGLMLSAYRRKDMWRPNTYMNLATKVE
ncbi:FtsW/RodA/SpoVE family cell cycle protein [Paenibacillus sp. L3-i20]|uniref:FtsW/RodA/SpoVE family cell cycle protein n=1 Tax=Paenibacillus sp. L3-i20 TaxID=2905833 RepID=UPI001EDF9498|nr:FtsW/RodA/SpoVE family cell cycle protein [Paenibacillus sp. L3-i20]GKU77003.1 rod shape-determining protein RodA [Paenibacillus sp. L3-i20]